MNEDIKKLLDDAIKSIELVANHVTDSKEIPESVKMTAARAVTVVEEFNDALTDIDQFTTVICGKLVDIRTIDCITLNDGTVLQFDSDKSV